jgi:hypothetical protein
MDVLSTFRALVRVAFPRIDYYATYYGKVVKWNYDAQTVDIAPSDSRLPSMAGVPFRHGLPGTVADVGSGTSVEITWLNGDPSQPRAALWSGGETVLRLTLTADQIVLGSSDGAEPAARGQTLQHYLETVADLLEKHVHGAPGGATLVSDSLVSPALKVPSLLATNVKVK